MGEGKVPPFPECPLLSPPVLCLSRLRPGALTWAAFCTFTTLCTSCVKRTSGCKLLPFYIVCSFPRCYSAAYKQSLREEAGSLELKCEDKRTSLFSLTTGWNSVFQSWMKAIDKVAAGETQVHQPSVYQGTVNKGSLQCFHTVSQLLHLSQNL